MALRILATGKIRAGGEIEWKVAPPTVDTIEEQLDAAIARTQARIEATRRYLETTSHPSSSTRQHDMDLAWEEMQQSQQRRLFSDEELRAMEEEQPGADLRYGGW